MDQRRYHDITETEAKVLYAILRIQHDEMCRGGDEDKSTKEPPGATREKLMNFTGLSIPRLDRILAALKGSGYIVPAYLYDAFAVRSKTKKPPAKSRIFFELEPETSISARDTAALLLALLSYSRKGKGDEEGNIDLRSFVRELMKRRGGCEGLLYFKRSDIFGTVTYKGKINELIEAGHHVERVSAYFVRPRLKLYLERRYLRLVAEQVSLKDLATYSFPVGF